MRSTGSEARRKASRAAACARRSRERLRALGGVERDREPAGGCRVGPRERRPARRLHRPASARQAPPAAKAPAPRKEPTPRDVARRAFPPPTAPVTAAGSSRLSEPSSSIVRPSAATTAFDGARLRDEAVDHVLDDLVALGVAGADHLVVGHLAAVGLVLHHLHLGERRLHRLVDARGRIGRLRRGAARGSTALRPPSRRCACSCRSRSPSCRPGRSSGCCACCRRSSRAPPPDRAGAGRASCARRRARRRRASRARSGSSTSPPSGALGARAPARAAPPSCQFATISSRSATSRSVAAFR